MKVAVLGSGAGALAVATDTVWTTVLTCYDAIEDAAAAVTAAQAASFRAAPPGNHEHGVPTGSPTNARSCPAPATSSPDPTWPPRTAGPAAPEPPLERRPRTGPKPISIDLQSTGPRATLCGMANDCPVLMVLLWCQSVNDDVRLHGGAPAAQGRESCLGWDNP